MWKAKTIFIKKKVIDYNAKMSFTIYSSFNKQKICSKKTIDLQLYHVKTILLLIHLKSLSQKFQGDSSGLEFPFLNIAFL